MIELEAVSHSWPDGPPVLSGLSLRIAAGEKVVLLGANGSGKSTLLKLLDGLVFPAAGRYRYGGTTIDRAALRDRELARRFRREVVLLFQHPEAMLFNPTVAEEIAYTPRQLGLDPAARVARWAGQLAIEPLLGCPPHALSGGEKQKVALACILALDPALLLLDEPTANLDPRASGWLVDYLLDTPQTAIVSTHNLSMAAELGFRCLVLGSGGRLLFDGPVRQALGDMALMEAANLAHRHRHRHGSVEHAHPHTHDWDLGRSV
jgi:cobalt/nickel transport system ATP-binding protein